MREPQRMSVFARMLAAVALGALVFASSAEAQPAADDVVKCRRTIVKSFATYVKAQVKVRQKCNEAAVKAGDGMNAPGGTLPPGCDPNGKIPAALARMRAKITSACDVNGVTPALAGWPATCPNFEGGPCINAIGDGDDIADCLDCIGAGAAAQTMDLTYDDLEDPAGDGELIACQARIGKETAKFLVARQKILAKCRQRVDKGVIPGPCPDAVAQVSIDKAESKKVGKICRGCGSGSLDGVTCQAGGFSPNAIGFTPGCPAVSVPGGPACGAIGAVDTLDELVACVDCVATFKTDCLDRLSAPHQAPYPSECNPGGCPTQLQLDADADALDLDIGWPGFAHDISAPFMGRLTLALAGCQGAPPSCGQCSASGPVANAGGGAFANRRCADQTWVECASDGDCTAAGASGPCRFFLGPPVSTNIGGISVCSLTEITGPVTGTVDVAAGSAAVTIPFSLIQKNFAALPASSEPCPPCTGGTCNGGPRDGMPCVVHGHSTLFDDDVSFDCPPDDGGMVVSTPLVLQASTSGEVRQLSAASPNCRTAPNNNRKCMCDLCNVNTPQVCFTNAECPDNPPGTPGICGGRICFGGGNDGGPCSAASACPSGACATVSSGSTHPNQCDDFVCTPDTPPDDDSIDEGICAAGPFDLYCTIETFRGCLTNADCTAPGDTCFTGRFRPCFTTDGNIGEDVQVGGVAEPPVLGSANLVLGALSCIPPGGSGFNNAILGAPGLVRATLPVTASFY